MKVSNLGARQKKYLKNHNLDNKFQKQIKFLENNPRHPSLHTERLEPSHLRIYSFRIDRKYRGIFIIYDEKIEIIDINDHYSR